MGTNIENTAYDFQTDFVFCVLSTGESTKIAEKKVYKKERSTCTLDIHTFGFFCFPLPFGRAREAAETLGFTHTHAHKGSHL